MQYRQVRAIAGRGFAPDQFTTSLRGLWVDRHDRLYAAGDSRIKVFDSNGALLRQWSTSRPALSVAVAPNGHVFAGQSGQIEMFDPTSGKLLGAWTDPALLGSVTAIGFYRDSVLAADARDRTIRHYDTAGKLRNHIGNENRTKGFLVPNGWLDFDIDPHGIVHAANPGKHRVERYSLEGALLGRVGRFDGLDPAGFTGCCNPTNVALGPSGDLYLTEKAGPRAKVLDPEGNLCAVIATTAFDPEAKNMDVAVDSHGRVYVAETANLRILVFEKTEDAA